MLDILCLNDLDEFVDFFPFGAINRLVHQVLLVARHCAEDKYKHGLELNHLYTELLGQADQPRFLEEDPMDVMEARQLTLSYLLEHFEVTLLQVLLDLDQDLQNASHVVHVGGQTTVECMDVDLALTLAVVVQ